MTVTFLCNEMLDRLKISNYKGFSEYEVKFRDFTLLVGKNNAGKSTLVEALRLAAIVSKRYRGLVYRDPPEWTGEPRRNRGVTPSLQGLGINLRSPIYQYSDSLATIRLYFKDKASIKIIINSEGQLFSVVFKQNGKPIQGRADALKTKMPSTSVLPQLSLVEMDENRRGEDYVKGAMDTHLGSSHFRNQIALLSQHRPKFEYLLQSTWPGVDVHSYPKYDRLVDDPLQLIIRDQGFVSELASMGSGFQMWAQLVWFLARSEKDDILILDEPDVYMHPQLQTKLLAAVSQLGKQVVLTSHSTEIISNLAPEEIAIIDKDRVNTKYASDVQGVQEIIDHVGGLHHYQLSKLYQASRILFVEGKSDVKFLEIAASKLGLSNKYEGIPVIKIEGATNWRDIRLISKMLRERIGGTFRCFCLLDRDYKTDEDIADLTKKAKDQFIDMHVWRSKEFENYLCDCGGISRFLGTAGFDIHEETVQQKLLEISEGLVQDTIGCIADFLGSKNKGWSPSRCNKEAALLYSSAGEDSRGLNRFVSGKEVLKKCSAYYQDELNVGFSPIAILRNIKFLDNELVNLLNALTSKD